VEPNQAGNDIGSPENNRAQPASKRTTLATAKEADVANDDPYPQINILFTREPWMREASCRDMPTDWWFPERCHNWSKAKAICNECPVKQDCLDYSLTLPVCVGIWGGLTGRERRQYKSLKGDGPINHGTNSGYVIHRRRGEEPCQKCREAHATYTSIRRRIQHRDD